MAGTKVPKRKTRWMSSSRREALAAYGFLLPNLLGFLAFTSIPVIASLLMAFSHWNIFKPPFWVGFENFKNLLWFHREAGHVAPNDPFFWQYVYNTVYLMVGVPLTMAGSLVTALLMNQKLRGVVLLRTIYFLPAVCSGVAMLILWKYLFNADIGLINKSLRLIGGVIFGSRILGIGFAALCGLLLGAVLVAVAAAAWSLLSWLFSKLGLRWIGGARRIVLTLCGLATAGLLIYRFQAFHVVLSSFFADPPDWLGTTLWAKPSLILMGFWGGLGGYNMILYLAALQGVPRSYYEAAEIDGAGPWARFWSITWPMISPTTFFILIMSVIGGFQGGFMTANVMTGGGPAGSTTTIEYYLFQTAFEKFNMGYASAIAWFLFAVIFVLTLATWKLGGRVVTYD